MFEVEEGPLEPLVCVGEEEKGVEEAFCGNSAAKRLWEDEEEVGDGGVEGMYVVEAGSKGGVGG